MTESSAEANVVRLLREGNADQRQVAVVALGAQEPRTTTAEELLLLALEDRDLDVRLTAVGALIVRDPNRPAGPILARLRRAEGIEDLQSPATPAEVIRYGLAALRSIPSAELLGEALQSSDPELRARAAFLLSRTKDDRAVAHLRKALADHDAVVRQQAALGLFQLGPAAFPLIEDALRDTDDEVRAGAAGSLSILSASGDAGAELVEAALRDPARTVRKYVASPKEH